MRSLSHSLFLDDVVLLISFCFYYYCYCRCWLVLDEAASVQLLKKVIILPRATPHWNAHTHVQRDEKKEEGLAHDDVAVRRGGVHSSSLLPFCFWAGMLASAQAQDGGRRTTVSKNKSPLENWAYFSTLKQKTGTLRGFVTLIQAYF